MSGSGGRHRWRRRAVILLLVLATLTAALTIVELWLRRSFPSALAHIFQLQGMWLEADGGVRLAPGFRGEMQLLGNTTRIETNGLGLRGPPLTAADRRVLCLGDSQVFGFGVQAEDSIPAVLERSLRSEGLRVAVANGGIPAAGQFDQLPLVSHLLPRWRPDLIVSCVFYNDYENNFEPPKGVVDGMMLSGPGLRLLQASWRARLSVRFRLAWLLEEAIDKHLPAWSMDRSAMLAPESERNGFVDFPPLPQRAAGVFMDLRVETPALRRIMARMLGLFAELRARAEGVPIVVVVLPAREHTSAAAYAAALTAAGFDPQLYERGASTRRLAAGCATLGLEFVDLLPAFETASDPSVFYITGDGHFSASGHRFVADCLAPVVRRHLR